MNTDNQCNKLALNIKSEWVDNPPHTHTNTLTQPRLQTQIHMCKCTHTHTHAHTPNKQMVRGQLWSQQLREKVTFLMLITKFSCQTELLPECLRGQKNRGNGEEKEKKRRKAII